MIRMKKDKKRKKKKKKKKKFNTYSEPTLAILGLNLFAVTHPVAVPAPQSSTVVHTNRVNALDLETSTLELIDSPAKRSRGVSTGEDIFVHEKTPSKVLVLPALAQTGVLHEENTVVIKHVVDLAEKGREVAHTDVLRHLETGDLVVLALGNGGIAVVHAENTGLVLRNANLAQAVVAPGCLVAAESNTSDVGAVVCRGEFGEGTPATAQVEHAFAGFEANLLANNGELVVLELFKRLFLVDVGDDAGGVDHAGSEEPAVKVIAAVVVVTHLLLVLGARVHDDFGHHARQEEPEQAQGEAEVGPIVSVLENLKRVAIEVDIAVKVLFMERLHGDLAAATVLGLVLVLVEGEVRLDGCTRVLDLLVLAWSISRGKSPERHEDGNGSQDGEEDPCLETTIHLPGKVAGNTSKKADENLVVERLATSGIGWERCILDGGILKTIVSKHNSQFRSCHRSTQHSCLD